MCSVVATTTSSLLEYIGTSDLHGSLLESAGVSRVLCCHDHNKISSRIRWVSCVLCCHDHNKMEDKFLHRFFYHLYRHDNPTVSTSAKNTQCTIAIELGKEKQSQHAQNTWANKCLVWAQKRVGIPHPGLHGAYLCGVSPPVRNGGRPASPRSEKNTVPAPDAVLLALPKRIREFSDPWAARENMSYPAGGPTEGSGARERKRPTYGHGAGPAEDSGAGERPASADVGGGAGPTEDSGTGERLASAGERGGAGTM